MHTSLSNIRRALIIGITISIISYTYLFIPLSETATIFQTNSQPEPPSNLSFKTHSTASTVKTEAPVETVDLAHVWRTYAGTSRIPFIVHQTYKSTDLLAPYYMSLLGLLRTHRFRDPRRHPLSSPTIYNLSASATSQSHSGRGRDVPIEQAPRYGYYFWTDASISEYVADNEKRPEFGVFKTLRVKLETADAIRYFALYEYGGIYLGIRLPHSCLLRQCIFINPYSSRYSYYVDAYEFKKD